MQALISIGIKRAANKIEIEVFVARPGVAIGRVEKE
jgi:ribosomal protein S3